MFNTCAFADNIPPSPELFPSGTFGDARRNTSKARATKTWDTSLVKQFPIREQKHLEFRAEFFNILNHVNYLFGTVWRDQRSSRPRGAMNRAVFGYPQAARSPRQIQFALKFYF